MTRRTKLIEQLAHQSTWRLIGLTIITLGVYTAYYARRQSRVINEHVEPEERISNGLLNLISVAHWLYALLLPMIFLFLVLGMIDLSGTIDTIHTVISWIGTIAMIVWAFKVKNRVNHLLGMHYNHPRRFKGLWSFLFADLYFNYKVNQLAKEMQANTTHFDDERVYGDESLSTVDELKAAEKNDLYG